MLSLLFEGKIAIAETPGSQHDPPDFVGHDPFWEVGAVGAAALPALALLAPQSRHGFAPDRARMYDDSANAASNIALWTGTLALLAGAGGAAAATDRQFRWQDLRASLIVAEGTLLGATVTSLPKRIFGRCRPYAWDAMRQRCDPEADDYAYESFWSGHTATLAAAAGAASCLALRESRLGWMAVVGVFGELLAGTTGTLRVAAGFHSWSDVGAGFVAGNALGAAMCLIHPDAKGSRGPTLAPTRDGLRLDWSF